MSKTEFAAHLGFKKSYITQLNKDGRLVLDDRGRVVVAESLQRIEATRDPAMQSTVERHARARLDRNHPHPSPLPPAGEGVVGARNHAHPGAIQPAGEGVLEDELGERIAVIEHDFQSARAKREHFAALREELRHRQEAHELIEVDEARRIMADVLTTLRTRLEALPSTVVPRLAAQPDEAAMVAMLADEIEFLLGDAEQQFHKFGSEL